MTKDYWLQSALTNDVLVAELLLRMKHSSDSDLDSDSLRPPPPPATSTAITPIVPPRWGQRKNRSKSTAPTTTVVNGYGKEHRGSPTTHLSWSGGGASTSDGYEDSSRPSDLSSGCRSVKASEGGSISSYNKSEKRKELASMRVNLDQHMASSENLTRIKVRKMGQNDRQTELCKAETEGPRRGFVLPDLNMEPDEEDLPMMS